MNCPKCGGNTVVKDSNPKVDQVRRRRECVVCNHRFTTVEIDFDSYKTLMPIDKQSLEQAISDVCAELQKRLCSALNFNK